MHVGFKTDKGILRSSNEDACFVLLHDKVYILADGVGGGNSGEIASRTAVSEKANYVVKHPLSHLLDKYEIVGYMRDAFEAANTKIYDMARAHEENFGMATTAIIVYVNKGKAYIGNIGDSRVYLYRNGDYLQLTEDHTYVNTLVKAGILSREEADQDERKNVIIKALGAEPTVEPDFFQVEVKKGDILLACSDGLYDEVSDEEIVEIIKEKDNMNELAAELIARANRNGGRDNITIITLQITEEEIDE
ncbi:MAG: Stp1/IreP family PP2C-type Ser/Thr phosphatase [Firmicutes bacterium]|nr:Stp1/IreP family PP2C-type Ser/Thr phosphatase [Bacillota bacterium]